MAERVVNFDTVQARRLSTIFTRPTLRELAQGRTSPLLGEFARTLPTSARRASVGELFDVVYQRLENVYRNEYIYKNTIANKIVFGMHSPATASVMSEFGVKTSVADMVIVNGTSSVYEIKTDLDSLARLPEQLANYRHVFDRLWVVTSARGEAAVAKMTPTDIGILVLTERGSLSKARLAMPNAANTNPSVIFNCLRREEYLRILLRRFGEVPKLPRGLLGSAAREAFCKLSPEVAHAEMVTELRRRSTSPELCVFARSLPNSLRTLGLSEPLSARRRAIVLQTLAQPATLRKD